MVSPNAVFTELVATTLRNHRKNLVDNVSNSNFLLKHLRENGGVRKLDGGYSITTSLDYASNGTYQRFSGYDPLNIGASDVLTAADFQWRQMALNVVASGQDIRINSGKNALMDLVKSRVENAYRTFRNNLSLDIYSDGTLPNQINGLQALVSDTGTGTIGGIDASIWSFWRNVVQSAAAPLGGGAPVAVTAATIESLMLSLYLALVRGGDMPKVIICDNNYFSLYEQSQVSLKRYTSDTKASGGFVSLKYKNADVIFDGGSGIPNNRMYMLNTDYMKLVIHKDADMTLMDEIRSPNQDASVNPVLLMCNLEVTNRARQGVLKP